MVVAVRGGRRLRESSLGWGTPRNLERSSGGGSARRVAVTREEPWMGNAVQPRAQQQVATAGARQAGARAPRHQTPIPFARLALPPPLLCRHSYAGVHWSDRGYNALQVTGAANFFLNQVRGEAGGGPLRVCVWDHRRGWLSTPAAASAAAPPPAHTPRFPRGAPLPRQVKVMNADNGIFMAHTDRSTVRDFVVDVTKPRLTDPKGFNGARGCVSVRVWCHTGDVLGWGAAGRRAGGSAAAPVPTAAASRTAGATCPCRPPRHLHQPGLLQPGGALCCVVQVHPRWVGGRGCVRGWLRGLNRVLAGQHPAAPASTDHMPPCLRPSPALLADVTVSEGASLNVFRNGRGTDMNMDHHRGGPFANLFTDIDVVSF